MKEQTKHPQVLALPIEAIEVRNIEGSTSVLMRFQARRPSSQGQPEWSVWHALPENLARELVKGIQGTLPP